MQPKISDNFKNECEKLIQNGKEELLSYFNSTNPHESLFKCIRIFRSIKDMSKTIGDLELCNYAQYVADLILVVVKLGLSKQQQQILLDECQNISNYLDNQLPSFSYAYTISSFISLNLVSNKWGGWSRVTSRASKDTGPIEYCDYYMQSNVLKCTNPLPELYLQVFRSLINCDLQSVDIICDNYFEVESSKTSIYMRPFKNAHDFCGFFAMEFQNQELMNYLANAMATKMGVSDLVKTTEVTEDILAEIFSTWSGRTISEWDKEDLSVEMGRIVTNANTSMLVHSGENKVYTYKMVFHLAHGWFDFKIIFYDQVENIQRRILVVDDSKTIRHAMITALKKESFITEEASDGEEAINKYELFSPDLVIIDLNMPKLSGLETISKIKEMDKNAKFVILSASNKKEDMEKAKSLGVLFFISKPMYMDFILETINKISFTHSDDSLGTNDSNREWRKEGARKENNASNANLTQEEDFEKVNWEEHSITKLDKILLVDDSIAIRTIVGEYLKKKGLQVIEAVNGEEAIEQFKLHLPPMVIMDLVLPGMTGLAAMNAIHEQNKEVRFIVLMGKEQSQQDINSLEAVDVSYYISKSLVMSKMIEEIKSFSGSKNEDGQSISLNQKRILLVNQSKTLRYIMRVILNSEGLEINETSSGYEAIEMYKKYMPVLTIMDLNLPYLSGLEAMAKIREINSAARFLILSSRPKNNDVSNLLQVVKNSFY